jgi:hypothetical protein
VYETRPSVRRPPRFAVLATGSVLLLLFGLAVLAPFHFFPFFPLIWVLPFLAMRAMWMAPTRSRVIPAGQSVVSENGKEKELLVALERRAEITAVLAALETSLGVAEADEMLSRLAENGHLQVHAREGRLAYSLWDVERRNEIEGNDH